MVSVFMWTERATGNNTDLNWYLKNEAIKSTIFFLVFNAKF